MQKSNFFHFDSLAVFSIHRGVGPLDSLAWGKDTIIRRDARCNHFSLDLEFFHRLGWTKV